VDRSKYGRWKEERFGLGWGVSQWKNTTKMVGMNGLELSTTAFLRYLPESASEQWCSAMPKEQKNLPELFKRYLDAATQ